MPSDSDFATPITYRRKCGAERVPFSEEGSNSAPSSVKEIKFETLGQAQEQRALCAFHVIPILHHPALRFLVSIPSPIKAL